MAPSTPGYHTVGGRIFFHREKGVCVDEAISVKSRVPNDGIYLHESVRHYINFANDLQELNYYHYRWSNFRFPEIHELKPEKIEINNIRYAEELSLTYLRCSQEFHKLSYETSSILSSSQARNKEYQKHLQDQKDHKFVPEFSRATLSHFVLRDFTSSFEQLQNNPSTHIATQLDRISGYVSNFFAVTSTKENIKLQKKVFYLSILVLALAILTILFASWNKDTVIQKIIDSIN
jgi:hypothetical protein